MVNNLFYLSCIDDIGGIETFLYNIAAKYGDRDILIVYSHGDRAQINRLQRVARVKKFDWTVIRCRRAFWAYNADILDYVVADEHIMMLHGDYKALGMWGSLPTYPQITRYIGVSRQVCASFEELSGKHAELAYNPLVVPEPRKMLRLISATRLSREKGRDRMEILAKALDRAGIRYTWEVFTNDTNPIPGDNFVWRKPRLDIIDHIAAADYLVQLSDTEGCPYAIREALAVGTPVIVTDIPVIHEEGMVINGENGWILPLDMSDLPLREIAHGLPPFTWTPPPDRWDEILVPGKGTYREEIKDARTIRCTMMYHDMELDRDVAEGEVLTVRKERAELIVSKNFAEFYEEDLV